MSTHLGSGEGTTRNTNKRGTPDPPRQAQHPEENAEQGCAPRGLRTPKLPRRPRSGGGGTTDRRFLRNRAPSSQTSDFGVQASSHRTCVRARSFHVNLSRPRTFEHEHGFQIYPEDFTAQGTSAGGQRVVSARTWFPSPLNVAPLTGARSGLGCATRPRPPLERPTPARGRSAGAASSRRAPRGAGAPPAGTPPPTLTPAPPRDPLRSGPRGFPGTLWPSRAAARAARPEGTRPNVRPGPPGSGRAAAEALAARCPRR